MIRSHTSKQIKPGMKGEEVTIAGWVDSKRVLGKLIFLKIRDSQGIVQVTIKKDREPEEVFEEAQDVTQESVVSVKGKIKETDQTEKGFEITPTEINVLNKAGTPLPLELEEDVQSDLDTRLNKRFIDLRKPEKAAIFQVRNAALTGIRESMENQGFVEIHTPKIIREGVEGGSTLFTVKYFDEEAYLSQSPQLFKQMMMASGFEKVYEIGNYFRAEKSSTSRHTSEFTGWDFEMSFIENQEDVMEVLEKTMVETIQYVTENAQDHLESLNIDLEEPKTPFKRIKYEKARELLKEEGKEIPRGADIDREGEKIIGRMMEEEGYDLYFIKEYPFEEKPFYIMEKDEEPFYCNSFDLDYKGIEITSGGQREHRLEKLLKNIKQQGLDPEAFDHYISSFKYGMPPHGGMGTGLDRIVQQMLNLSNIRETVLFPRDIKRLKP